MCRPWKREVVKSEDDREGWGRVVVGSAEVKVSSLSSSAGVVVVSVSPESSDVAVRAANFDGNVASCCVVSLTG